MTNRAPCLGGDLPLAVKELPDSQRRIYLCSSPQSMAIRLELVPWRSPYA